jgi:hypothetical protein
MARTRCCHGRKPVHEQKSYRSDLGRAAGRRINPLRGVRQESNSKVSPTGRNSQRDKPSPRQQRRKSAKGKEKAPFFRFMDLPAELRSLVLEKAVEDETAFISPRTRGALACSSSLPRVNKQVREEFLSVLYLQAPLVRVKVNNFDFRYLITFFNRLSDRELDALPSIVLPVERKVIVELEISRHPLLDLYLKPKLMQWLRRVAHPTKKGTKVSVSYECVWEEVPQAIFFSHRDWLRECGRTVGMTLTERSTAEWDKMEAAVREYRQRPSE